MNLPDSLAEKALRESGATDDSRLLELRAEVRSSHVPLAELIIRYRLMSEEELAKFYARELDLPYVSLSVTDIAPVILSLLPEHLSRRYRTIVFDIDPDDTRLIASDSLVSPEAHEFLAKTIGPNYRVHITSPSHLHSALDNYRQLNLLHSQAVKSSLKGGGVETKDNPKIHQTVHHILEQAIEQRVSSVHIEQQGEVLVIRFRIDGGLKEAYKLPAAVRVPLNNRIKAMAGLSGNGLQEGSFRIESHYAVFRINVLSLPVVGGEKLTLNILDESLRVPDLNELGLWGKNLEVVEHGVIAHHGLVLASGPKDSGKTTLLYSCLKSLKTGSLSVLSIEDRLSFRVAGVNQIELSEILPTYEAALEASLKQSPDVILIDKVLSPFVADQLIDASSNSLCLAGVSADGSISVFRQLGRLGASPFSLAHTSHLVVGTRLVRRLCDRCRESIHPTNEVLHSLIKSLGVSSYGGVKALHSLEKQAATHGLGFDKKTDLSTSETSIKRLWQASSSGCAQCNYTGFKGRIGLQEVLFVSDEVKAKIAAEATEADIQKLAIESGFIPVVIDGLVKCLRGLTSISEVLS